MDVILFGLVLIANILIFGGWMHVVMEYFGERTWGYVVVLICMVIQVCVNVLIFPGVFN